MSARCRNGTKSCRSSSARDASTTGRSWWLSAAARPCPGMCLMTGSTPPAISPSAAARPSSATVSGSSPVGAVADHVVGAGDRDVEHRHAIDGDADGAQIMRHEPGAETGDLAVVERVVAGKPAIGAPRRIGRPVRRSHALDAPALLVDQDRGVAADGLAQRRGERRQLRRRLDVALEEDEAPRRRGTEEGVLLGREHRAGAAGDEGARRHCGRKRRITRGLAGAGGVQFLATKQGPPAALSFVQSSVASSRDIGPTRTR